MNEQQWRNNNSLDAPAESTTVTTSQASTLAPPPKRGSMKLWLWVVVAVLLLFAVGTTLVALRQVTARNIAQKNLDARKQNVKVQDVDLSAISKSPTNIALNSADKVVVNGQLQANNGIVLSPTAQPKGPTIGALYFDQTTNQVQYYNGTGYVPFASQIDVSSLQTNIASLNAQIAALTQNITSLSQNTGKGSVTTLQTLSGALNMLGTGGLTVSASGSSITLSLPQNLTTTSSPQFANISLTAPLAISSGGTGQTSFAANGVVTTDGSGALMTLTTSTPNLCLITNGSGVPVFGACSTGSVASLNSLTGAINLLNATVSGQNITIDDAKADDGTTKGIASFNSTNFSDNGAGTINLAQDIDSSASPIFAGLTLTGAPLDVASGGTGASSLTAGELVIGNGASALSTVASGVDGDCLITSSSTVQWGSCGSSGLSAIGTIDAQTKSSDGAVISGTSIYLQTADDTYPGLVSTVAQTFAGNKTFNDDVIVLGKIGDTTKAFILQGSDSSVITATDVTQAYTTTLQFATPTRGNLITVPNETGKLCTSDISNTSYVNSDPNYDTCYSKFAPVSGSSAYIQFAPASAQVDSNTDPNSSTIYVAKDNTNGNIIRIQGSDGATMSDSFVIQGNGDTYFRSLTQSTTAFRILDSQNRTAFTINTQPSSPACYIDFESPLLGASCALNTVALFSPYDVATSAPSTTTTAYSYTAEPSYDHSQTALTGNSLKISNGTGSPTVTTHGAYYPTTLTAGQPYYVSFYAMLDYSNTGSYSSPKVGAGYYNGSDPANGVRTAACSTAKISKPTFKSGVYTQKWTHYTCSLTPDASNGGNAEGLYFYLTGQFSNQAEGKTWYMDDIVVKPGQSLSDYQNYATISAPLEVSPPQPFDSAFSVKTSGSTLLNVDTYNAVVDINATKGFDDGVTTVPALRVQNDNGPVAYFASTDGANGSATVIIQATTSQDQKLLSLVSSNGYEVTAFDQNGRLVFHENAASNSQTATFRFNGSNDLSANRTYYLPDATGTICLDSGNCNAGSGAPTLQNAYTASTGGSTPEILLDSTRGALDVQDASPTTSGSLLRVWASGANISSGTALVNVNSTGQVQLQNSVDSNTAFTVRKLSGASVFSVDTANDKVGTEDSLSANTQDLRISTGNATVGADLSSGNLYIDTGTQTGTGTSGSINIGDTNASAINIGRSSLTTVNILSGRALFDGTITVDGANKLIGTLNRTSTNSDQLTLQSGDVTVSGDSGALQISSGTSASGNTGAVTLGSGNAAAGNSGDVSIDVGSASGTKGMLSLGGTNASTLTIGNVAATVAIQGNASTTLSAKSGIYTTTLGFDTTGLAASNTFLLPVVAGPSSYTICTSAGNCGASVGGGATVALDNLSSVAINTSLLPGTAGAVNLGSSTKPFGELFIAGTSGSPGSESFKFTGVATATRTITVPDATGTICLNTNNCGYASGSGTSGAYIQNQNSGQQASSDFWISGTGRADTSLQAPLIDTATAAALNIGTTNATAINLNQNVTIAGSKTFTTGTGAISLQGDVTIASGKTFVQNGTGTFTTGSGTNTLSGDVIVANTKNITFGTGASTGSFDQSLSTGTFKTGNGAVSLNGNTTVASSKTFTVQGVTSVQTTSANAFTVQTGGGSSTLLTADTSNMRVAVGSIGTATGQLYVAGLMPTAAIGSVTSTHSVPRWSAIQGNYLYQTNFSDSTLEIFDVTNPANPVSISSIATGTNPRGIAVSGRYAYVANSGSHTLTIYDISNPTTPSLVSTFTIAGTTPTPYGLTLSGRYVYITNFFAASSNHLQIIDVSNPGVPVSVGTVSTGSQITNPNWVVVRGRYAYVTGSGTNSGFAIYDISNPASPSFAGGTVSIPTVTPTSVDVVGRYAYVINQTGTSQLQIYDISNPASIPAAVGTLSLGSAGSRMVSVQGRYAYVINSSTNTLQIIDVSNVASPTSIGTVATSTGPLSLTVSGRYAYVGNQTTNITQIFDIGGLYTNSLEAGLLRTTDLQVVNNITIANNASVQGGFNVTGTIQAATGAGITGASTFNTGATTTTAITLQGVSSQTADLFQAKDSSSNVLFRISSSGVIGSTETTSASTNSAAFTLRTGNASGTTSDSGALTVSTGTATRNSGTITIATGATSTSASGALTISTGTTTTATPGSITIASGTASGSSTFVSGAVTITSGVVNNANGATGAVTVSSGANSQNATGGLTLQTGNSGFANSGDVSLKSGGIIQGSGSKSGELTLSTGTNAFGATNVSSGSIWIDVGAASGTGTAGGINIGHSGNANTIQIGNTTGAVTQTINIGNNTTASSTNNVTLGSTQDSSVTLMQGGTGTGASAAIRLIPANAGDILIGGSAQTGAITIGQSTDNQILNFGTGATASGKTLTIHIGDAGAAGSTTNITVGSAIAGTLTVKSAAVFNKTLTVGGHIITTNNSGSTTIAAGAAACTTPTVTITGNDTAGQISVITGTGCGATGVLGTVSFASSYASAPRVMISPANANGSTLQYFSGASNTTTFTLDTNTAPANSTTYLYNYWIAQ